MAPRNRTPRRPTVSPHSGEGREIGLDDREIPSGLNHLSNPETPSAKPAVPARQHLPAMNEHGVPDDNPDASYEQPEAGTVLISEPLPEGREYYAVPVYQVEEPGKGKVHRKALCNSITVPASGSDPIRVCSRDDGRVEVRILNEDPANDIRFSESIATLIEGGGALLWHGTNSYTPIPTQDELWAVGASAACVMSVVLVTEVND